MAQIANIDFDTNVDFDRLGLIFVNVYFRGISSTVRRCIEKETGMEYAAKIIDISNETNEDMHTMKDATLQEVQILRRVAGHPYISKFLILLLFRNGKNRKRDL